MCQGGWVTVDGLYLLCVITVCSCCMQLNAHNACHIWVCCAVLCIHTCNSTHEHPNTHIHTQVPQHTQVVLGHWVARAVATVVLSARRTLASTETKIGRPPKGVDYVGVFFCFCFLFLFVCVCVLKGPPPTHTTNPHQQPTLLVPLHHTSPLLTQV